MRRKLLTVVGGSVVLAVAPAACGSTSGSSASGSSGGKALTVGLIMLQGDQYFQGVHSGLKAAVTPDGGTVVAANSNTTQARKRRRRRT